MILRIRPSSVDPGAAVNPNRALVSITIPPRAVACFLARCWTRRCQSRRAARGGSPWAASCCAPPDIDAAPPASDGVGTRNARRSRTYERYKVASLPLVVARTRESLCQNNVERPSIGTNWMPIGIFKKRGGVMASGSPAPSPSPGSSTLDTLRIVAEIAASLCAVAAILISVVTWRSQQHFNSQQSGFNASQQKFNTAQQQLALSDEHRQDELYASKVAIWQDVQFITTHDSYGNDLPGYLTFLVVQNRGEAPLNQVVVTWPQLPGGKIKTATAVLDFIPPCSSVMMSEEYFSDERFSIDLGEEANAGGLPVLEFNDANRISWARSASGQLTRISSAKLKKYEGDEASFYIAPNKQKTVKITETANCGN